jgi:hypothetical protein
MLPAAAGMVVLWYWYVSVPEGTTIPVSTVTCGYGMVC